MSKHDQGAVSTCEAGAAGTGQNGNPMSMLIDDEIRQNISQEPEGQLINFKTLTWWQGGTVLIAETVSLGILSLPWALSQLGLVPGVLVIVVLGGMATYSALMIGEFKRMYPSVNNFGDAAEIMGHAIGMGRVFQEVFGWAQTLLQIFVSASHLLTWTICMNNLTNSSVCTIIWAVSGMVLFWLFNLPRTLRWTSVMSGVSVVSIVMATLITVGDVAVHRPLREEFDWISQSKFTRAFLAVSNISAAYASHSCAFGVLNEFKKPEDWPKAIALLQTVTISLYLITAIVIYVCVGNSITGPALSAASTIRMRKVIWAIAIPTIVIGGVIYNFIAAKYIFNRLCGSTDLTKLRTLKSTCVWVLVTFGVWCVSLIVAESIPVFTGLLGLVSALFISWFSFGLPGMFWLFMNRGQWFSPTRQTLKFICNASLVLTGTLLCTLGLWAAIDTVTDDATKPWTCASNVA